MFENYKIKRIQLLPMSDKENDNGFEDDFLLPLMETN